MKTTWLKMQKLAPLLGVVVISSGLVAAALYYFQLERRVREHEASAEAVDCVLQELKLNLALRSLRDGDVNGAAERLDVLLHRNVVRLNSELASADAKTQTYVDETRQRIALGLRAMARGEAAREGQQRREDLAAAESLLSRVRGPAEVTGDR